MNNEVELEATPLHELHRFHNATGDVVVMSAVLDGGERRVLKGPADSDGSPRKGMPYRFFGRKRMYRGEPQFAYRSFIPAGEPRSEQAVVAYLTNSPGVGVVMAERIWATLGEESIAVCRDEPDRAVELVHRLRYSVAAELSCWLESQGKSAELIAEVAGLLHKRGFPRETTALAINAWGNRSPAMIRRNPYLLMRFAGVGFKRADALYLELGGNPNRLKRQSLCIAHAIRERGGDTWHYAEVARQALQQSIGGAEARPGEAIRLAIRGGLLAATFTDGVAGPIDSFGDAMWLAERRQAASERRVAKEIKRLMDRPASWRSDQRTCVDSQLTEHQRLASCVATSQSVGVLSGSPGTGKTFTAAELVRQLGSGVRLAAPTGKAAVRLTETMNAAGIKLTATTIHSLLAAGPFGFGHNEDNPVAGRYILIDEASMIDTDLMASFLRAVPNGAHVLFIGDTNQLLPVGHGAPLRDLIASGVPTGDLTEILRNSGGIVEACAAIRNEQPIELADNLTQVATGDVAEVVQAAAVEHGVDPVWGVQVLCAVNAKSELSRKEINRRLQSALNRNEPSLGTFALADKVVCTQNAWLKPLKQPGPGSQINDDGNVRVANGEVGRVREIEGRRMVVELSSPSRLVYVPVGPQKESADGENDTGCHFDLAYGLSVHKSQGSEFPVVVICLDPSPSANRVMDRAWIYTAISRAKEQCVLWGGMKVVAAAVRKDRIKQRKTFLRERLEDIA